MKKHTNKLFIFLAMLALIASQIACDGETRGNGRILEGGEGGIVQPLWDCAQAILLGGSCH